VAALSKQLSAVMAATLAGAPVAFDPIDELLLRRDFKRLS
jgi:hypothetical protein